MHRLCSIKSGNLIVHSLHQKKGGWCTGQPSGENCGQTAAIMLPARNQRYRIEASYMQHVEVEQVRPRLPSHIQHAQLNAMCMSKSGRPYLDCISCMAANNMHICEVSSLGVVFEVCCSYCGDLGPQVQLLAQVCPSLQCAKALSASSVCLFTVPSVCVLGAQYAWRCNRYGVD